MLWEVEIVPRGRDAEKERVCQDVALLTHAATPPACVDLASRGYLLQGKLNQSGAEQLLHDLFLDPLAETGRVAPLNGFAGVSPTLDASLAPLATVLYKPGVMDPVAESVVLAAKDLAIDLEEVRTFRRYYSSQNLAPATRAVLLRRVLANDAIEQIVEGPLRLDHLTVDSKYQFQLIVVPLRGLDDDALVKLSKTGQLALNLAEMKAIQAHFRDQGRDPTDVELETLAQTWSEHCSHKTLKGRIEVHTIPSHSQGKGDTTLPPSPAVLVGRGDVLLPPSPPVLVGRGDGGEGVPGEGEPRLINNLLKETIFAATQEIRRRLGKDDWCVSVFEDNAGVVRFDEHFNICFKVETHNHPSAIEPYGGANTGLGGVIRDPLGTGLGAKPICNTDVFCFAPPDTDPSDLPPGVLHPKKVMQGVVAGVRDYGNRMGIATVNGAICFDPRYLGNPLVFCGTVGILPVDRCHKETKPGDLIVAVGGRTGRDGIHGATFSSIELTSESEKVSGGAVQIGNAIAEKKVLDVILQARDLNLYSAITDCGAGGFSSAIGEMGEKLGAHVELDKAPLKYQGLSYTEIWISEAQERMILAVPPANWERLQALCAGEDVEATVLGVFEPTGRLRLVANRQTVADLSMDFLHTGRPAVVRKATVLDRGPEALVRKGDGAKPQGAGDYNELLKRILASPNVCSKEWVIRQYDHEVQGGSVIKPLVGKHNDGPGDASVVMPVLGSWVGVAVGCGINPHFGDLDPYHMAALAIDEAVRNVVAVGADPSRIALLDNFCWGNTDRPEVLGSLVRAAEACHDVALAYTMPFISGKDSLNNEFHAGDRHITIPPTLLISALGRVNDVRRCVSMDLKEPGNILFQIGVTKNEMGGSHFNFVQGQPGGAVPKVDLTLAPKIFQKVHEAITLGLIRSCHDLSEGGLGVALAEMCFAGGIGADVTGLAALGVTDEVALFAESASRFLLEVTPKNSDNFLRLLGNDIPVAKLGQTTKEPRLRIACAAGEWLIWSPLDGLKAAWQGTLKW